MAEKFRFFDSTEDDFRVYRAAEYAAYFDALVKTGVFSDSLDALQVTADGTSLNTTVSAGKAFLLGYMYENDSPLQLAHDTPDPTLDRIDRVVIRLDLNQRTIKATIIKGTPSATPEVPQLVQDVAGQIYDVSLAQVTIKAGQSTIAQNQVIDDREYARYTSKPAWYPQGQIPMDAWIYTHFPNQLTAEEKVEIEANPSLMEIVNAQGTLKTHMADNVSHWHLIDEITLEVDAAQLDINLPINYKEFRIKVKNLKCTGNSGSTPISMQFDGDASSGYSYVITANGTSTLNNDKAFIPLSKSISTLELTSDVLILKGFNYTKITNSYILGGATNVLVLGTFNKSIINTINLISLVAAPMMAGATFEIWGR